MSEVMDMDMEDIRELLSGISDIDGDDDCIDDIDIKEFDFNDVVMNDIPPAGALMGSTLSPDSVAGHPMSGEDEERCDDAYSDTDASDLDIAVKIPSLSGTQTVKGENYTQSDTIIEMAMQQAIEALKARKDAPCYKMFMDCTDPNELVSVLFTLPGAKDKRYTVKKTYIKCFEIFPWFHLPSDTKRFRQNISQSGDMANIMQALKYFWTEDFSDENFNDLNRCFRNIMKKGEKVKFLTSIRDARVVMVSCMSSNTTNQSLESVQEVVADHGRRLDSVEGRLNDIEDGASAFENSSKRPRRGGDRAQFMRVRPRCRENMQCWCTPGRVFGIYTDGIGPLLPSSTTFRRHQLSGVVVYSTCPDIIEDHVDPNISDDYVPVVMVGKASVVLDNPKDYVTLLQNCDSTFDVYVNEKGKVRLKRPNLPLKCGEVRFGRVEANSNICFDENGLPWFQGVKGGVSVTVESSGSEMDIQRRRNGKIPPSLKTVMSTAIGKKAIHRLEGKISSKADRRAVNADMPESLRSISDNSDSEMDVLKSELDNICISVNEDGTHSVSFTSGHLGMTFRYDMGTKCIHVGTVLPDMQAEVGGVRAGDIVLAIGSKKGLKGKVSHRAEFQEYLNVMKCEDRPLKMTFQVPSEVLVS
mmetsp:Transcript_25618/g.37847  ORF Transcript_25618/g.37847 Transcript_25618/m.37847 type:complete len:641 (+) Transcript_25618:97-2019(+)